MIIEVDANADAGAVKQAIAEWYVLDMLEKSWGGLMEHTEQSYIRSAQTLPYLDQYPTKRFGIDQQVISPSDLVDCQLETAFTLGDVSEELIADKQLSDEFLLIWPAR